MKDKLHEQISALVDDELDEGEQALLLRQLENDAELSGRLSRFQLISDALQNHLPSRLNSGFHARVQAALADEPPVQRQRSGFAALFKPVAGLALAASVAMVAVLSLQSTRQDPEAVPAVASAPTHDSYIRAAADDSVPSGEPSAVPQNLEIYLANHSEYAVSRGILPYVRLVGHDMNPGNKE
jgi:sigma-E factor negative regulatory protein RseA